MTWTYSLIPDDRGLSVVADPDDSRRAAIVGIPGQGLLGFATIVATDGTQTLTKQVFLAIRSPNISSSIASLEYEFDWANHIQFAFNPADLDLLRLTLQFEFKEQIPIAGNFTPTIVFAFDPIVPVGPPTLVFEPELEVTFTPIEPVNNGS